jgi:hypothetical protein
MERILLVEPNYSNKYPPMGLMKIATYHRLKGDIVEFYKGEAPYTQIINTDRVYITTLFTFYYEIDIKCISHYAKYMSRDNIYIGGIAATILSNKYEQDTGIKNIIRGQLTDSGILGYGDNVNIDRLPLDYDILDDISYTYPAGDNYFIHTTRGCPRGCEFCAVRILEPKFKTTNHVIEQVKQIDEVYGEKRNLLIMDNNILCSKQLSEIIADIKYLGFNGEANFLYPNRFITLLKKIERRIGFNVNYYRQIEQMHQLLDAFSKRIHRYEKVYNEYIEVINSIKNSDDVLNSLRNNRDYLASIFDKYNSKAKMIRYVDFNQGIDARLINQHNTKLLSQIPIRPFRLAYDSINETETFVKATQIAIENNISHFSNYMLYNWEDEPKELWLRLFNATTLYNKYGDRIKGFSFPMKYAPIDQTNRNYIGKYWNKKYLGAINIIINVTKGVVAKEKDFFFEAFGSNLQEYYEILNMPDEFIRNRFYFKGNGLIKYWKSLYHFLSKQELTMLLDILCKAKTDHSVLYGNYPINLEKILVLYTINKTQFDRGEKTSESVIKEIEAIEEIKVANS